MTTKKLHIGYVSVASCYGLQYMLLNEGHKLSVLVEDYKLVPNYPKIEDITGLKRLFPNQLKIVEVKDLAKCDFIVFDYNNVASDVWEEVHALGIPTVGPDDFTDLLEEDRAFGKSVAKYCGLSVHEGKYFDNLKAAVRYLQSLDRKTEIFLKGAMTIHARNSEEAIHMLRNEGFRFFADDKKSKEARQNTKEIDGVYIEPKIEGYEVAYGAFWAGNVWAKDVVFTREFKHAMPDGQGSVLTGEIATAVAFMPFSEMPEAFRRAFTSIGKMLIGTKFRGFIDINTINNKSGTWFLEWTPRPGYPTELELAGWLAHCGLSYGKWLQGLATGMPLRLPTGICTAASLYAHGLGLPNADAGGLQPQVYGLEYVDEDTQFLPFDLIWGKKKQPLVSLWDRALFLARYKNVHCSRMRDQHEWKNLASELLKGMEKLYAWGHSFRKDLFDGKPELSFDCVAATLANQNVHNYVPAEKFKFVTGKGITRELSTQLYALELRSSFEKDSWEYGNFEEEGEANYVLMVGEKSDFVYGAALGTVQQDGSAYCSYVAVDPDYNGEGYGKQLMSKLEGLFSKQGVRCITLNATTQIQDWYKRQNYSLLVPHSDIMMKAL